MAEPLKEDEGILDIPADSYNDDVVNINRYINVAILTAQKTLAVGVLKHNIAEAITAYSILIEHLEMLCKANGYVGKDYDKNILEYRKSNEVKEVIDKNVRLAKIANKKLYYLMMEIGEKTPIDTPLLTKNDNLR